MPVCHFSICIGFITYCFAGNLKTFSKQSCYVNLDAIKSFFNNLITSPILSMGQLDIVVLATNSRAWLKL